jgi:hypothetical protein
MVLYVLNLCSYTSLLKCTVFAMYCVNATRSIDWRTKAAIAPIFISEIESYIKEALNPPGVICYQAAMSLRHWYSNFLPGLRKRPETGEAKSRTDCLRPRGQSAPFPGCAIQN